MSGVTAESDKYGPLAQITIYIWATSPNNYILCLESLRFSKGRGENIFSFVKGVGGKSFHLELPEKTSITHRL